MKLLLGFAVARFVGCGSTDHATPPSNVDAPSAIDAPIAIDAPPAIDAPTSCDPLADNDFDGAGSAHMKTGTACGSDPTVGCYGRPSTTGSVFTCYPEEPGSEDNTNGALVTAPIALNSCAPGYMAGFSNDAVGGMTIECYAFCKPGDAYLGNPNPQAPNGVSPHGCNTTDAEGIFGDIPDGGPTSNGEHCTYSWMFEQDSTTGVVHESPTSNTVGICFDHTKYKYDPTGGTNDTAILPPCAALPLASTPTALGATDLGCVSTTTGGISTTPHRRVIYIPGLPHFAASSSR